MRATVEITYEISNMLFIENRQKLLKSGRSFHKCHLTISLRIFVTLTNICFWYTVKYVMQCLVQ